MLKMIAKYKDECKFDYYTNSRKIPFEFGRKCFIIADNKYVKDFCNNYNEDQYQLFGFKNFSVYKQYNERFRHCFIYAHKIINYIKKEYKKLSLLERKTKSLDLHKPSSFIDDLLNNNVERITLETLINILEDLDLTKTDIYFFAEKRLNEEPTKYENRIIRDYIENI